MQPKNTDTNTLTLAIVGVVTIVAVIALVVWYFFFNDRSPETPEPEPFEFPESNVDVLPAPQPQPQYQSEELPPLDSLPEEDEEEEWHTFIHENNTIPVNPIDESPAPTTYQEFLDSGLIWEDAPYQPVTVITPFDMAPTMQPIITTVAPVGTIVEDDLEDCGTISVSGTNPSPSAIISSLQRNAAAECMGEAIGNDCEAASAEVRMSGGGGQIFVSEKVGGSCGIGMSTVDGTAYLCSLEAVMDYVSGDDKDEDEWIDEFDGDPDGTMAMVVANMTNVVSLAGTGGFNCEPYSVQ